jgi:hypothetical protein
VYFGTSVPVLDTTVRGDVVAGGIAADTSQSIFITGSVSLNVSGDALYTRRAACWRDASAGASWSMFPTASEGPVDDGVQGPLIHTFPVDGLFTPSASDVSPFDIGVCGTHVNGDGTVLLDSGSITYMVIQN